MANFKASSGSLGLVQSFSCTFLLLICNINSQEQVLLQFLRNLTSPPNHSKRARIEIMFFRVVEALKKIGGDLKFYFFSKVFVTKRYQLWSFQIPLGSVGVLIHKVFPRCLAQCQVH